ncbi:MAG: RecX family transcriptional regulator [Bacteroidaceae bacterium]|nr:RecX family transcriptional regulator [Bacteroidaceae bacterium]
MKADEVLYKLAARCSVSELCLSDVEGKLAKYDLPEEEKTRILRHLVEEKYIDDRRYAEAYVRDKYRFNKWGRMKIAQGLRMKGIDKETFATAMEAIDEAEYLDILRDLLKAKRKSTKGKNEYEVNGKLVRFATGRGFEYAAIRQCLGASIDEFEEWR